MLNPAMDLAGTPVRTALVLIGPTSSPAGGSVSAPIRRLGLDVDKVIDRPEMVDLARALASVKGVSAVNITVNEIDIETVGTVITVEGDDIDTDALFVAIEKAGAVLHSIDEVVAGDRIIDHVPRVR